MSAGEAVKGQRTVGEPDDRCPECGPDFYCLKCHAEEVQAERDRGDRLESANRGLIAKMEAHQARSEEYRAENVQLRNALRGLLKAMPRVEDAPVGPEDYWAVSPHRIGALTFGDIRRARHALAEPPTEEEK